MNANQHARPIVERLAEDERLRGDLSDAGFGPVLRLATRLVEGAAARAAGGPEPDVVLEQVGGQVVTLVRASERAAETGELDGVRAAVVAPLFADEALPGVLGNLAAPLEATTPDERAVEIARRIDRASGERAG